MRPLTFLDGGEIRVLIDECYFASTVPKFHWIWTKPHDTLRNVSDRRTTLIYMHLESDGICKDLVYFMFQIYTVGIDSWSYWSYLKHIM